MKRIALVTAIFVFAACSSGGDQPPADDSAAAAAVTNDSATVTPPVADSVPADSAVVPPDSVQDQ